MDTYTVNNNRAIFCFSYLIKLIAILVFSFYSPFVFSQLDYIHYVPPMYNGSSTNNDIGRNVAVITTDSRDMVEVSIFLGDGTLLDKINVSRTTPYEYVFKTPGDVDYGTISNYPTVYDFPLGIIGGNELNKVLPSVGLKFIAYDAPIYVNVRHSTQDQGGSLTTKGRFAMGKEFRSGHIYTDAMNATSRRSHFISVMATEDGTQVNFSDIKIGMLSDFSQPSYIKTVLPSDVISVILDEGESYVIAVDHNLSGFDQNKRNDMNGSYINSTKDIIVNTGSWTSGPSNGQDMGIDQIVPIDQIRDKYVVMKGQGNNSTERPIVVATVDDTYVYVNGGGTPINPVAPLAAGDFIPIPSSYYSHDNGIYTMFIDTKDKNAYVYQTMSGSSSRIGPTVGMNFIPPLSATGMHQVDIPFADQLAKKTVYSVITILTQKGSTLQYENTIGATTTIVELTESDASSIPGNNEWVSYKLNDVEGNIRFQSSRALNVAWTVQSGYVGSAGYYSGFSKAISKIIPELHVNLETELGVICESYNDNIEVAINATPTPDFYEWYENEIAEENILFVNEKLIVPAPDVPTKYIVKAYFRDPTLDILYNGNFSSGRGEFETDYDMVTENMHEPGKFAINFSPKRENAAFEDYDDMDGGGLMLIVYSDGLGNTIYKKLDTPIERNTNYILKVHGKMAKLNSPQLLDIYINEEKIHSNFQINDVAKWQSASALWKSKDNQKATISLVDANPSGVPGVFAIDSITFAPAVEDQAEFNALVVPNYSYTPYNEPQHFCIGESGEIDISNGDVSWYTYLWEKKIGESYVTITDETITGIDSHILGFSNVSADNAGIYRCTIAFKEEFQQCGDAFDPATLEVQILADETASLSLLEGDLDLCEGESTTLQAVVTGDYSEVVWFVNTEQKYVGNVFEFNLDKTYPAGDYQIRCDVGNACAPLSKETSIQIYGSPELNDFIVPTGLCDLESVDLTAIVDVVPVGSTLEYSWYRDEDLLETNNLDVYGILPNINDSYYKVAVAARYNIGEVNEHSCSGNELVENLAANAIHPQVELTPLSNIVVCEDGSHTYKAELSTPSDSYTYNWEIPFVTEDDKTGADFVLSVVTPEMAGNYKVTVSNRCGSAIASSDLSVTQKLLLDRISIDKNGPYCLNESVEISITDNGEAKLYKAENITTGQIVNPIVNPYSLLVTDLNQGEWKITAEGFCGTVVDQTFDIDLLEDFSDPSLDDITTCFGENVNFEVQIADIPTSSVLSYSWTDPNGDPITVSDPFKIINILDVQAADFGTYTCVLSNQCGYSKTVTANLDAEKVISTQTASALAVCQGTNNYRFDIDYIGTPTFSWRFNNPTGTVIGVLDHYEIATVETIDAGIYYCDVTLSCGDVVKYQRELIVNDHITVEKETAASIDICQGAQTELRISTTGAESTIQWFDNDNVELTAYSGKTRLSTGIINTPGTYTYTYKLTADCENPTGDFDVVVHAKPLINPIALIEACEGDIALDMVIAGTDYTSSSWWNADESTKLGDGVSYTLVGASYPSSSDNYVAVVNTDYCGDVKTVAQVEVHEPISVVSNSNLNPTPCVDETLSLLVNGTGADLAYNWYKTDAPTVSLSLGVTLDLGAADLSDEGSYRCELLSGNGCGNVNVDFIVDVREHASITNPVLAPICEDDGPANLSVTSTVEGTPSYQWFDNDGIIDGAILSSLSVPLAGNNGQSYYCEVSGDFCDPIDSDKANLIVKENVTITTQPNDLTVSENASAVFTAHASGTGPKTYQWYEDSGSGFVSMGITPASAQTNSMTLVSVPFSHNGYKYYCEVTNSCTSEGSNPATITVVVDNRITAQAHDAEVCEGNSFAFTVEYDNTTTSCIWEYDNGTGYNPVGGLGSSSFSSTSSTLTITSATLAMDTWKFRALVQRTSFVDNLSNDVTVNVYESVSFDNILDVVLCKDDGVSFSLNNLIGTAPYTYDWKRNGTTIGSNPSLNLSGALATDDIYSVGVTNALCPVVTKTFNISHHTDLAITGLSNIDPVCHNVSEDLVVSITKDPALTETYAWTKDGVALVGNTNTYTIDGANISQTGVYEVEVDDGCMTKSISSFINVLNDIALSTTSPITNNLCEGEDLSLHVTGSGVDLNYNWYKTTDPGISLSSDETLVKLSMLSTDAGIYRCDLTSASGCNTDFVEFTVNVGKHATITNPADFSICEGVGNHVFNVVATGEGGLTYKWYDNDALMGGETAASLSVASLLVNDGHSYYCEVQGSSCDEAVSEKATLTVKENVAVSKHPVGVVVADGGSAVFTVKASGHGPYTYLWFEDNGSGFTAMTAETSNTLSLPTVLLVDDGHLYYCRVSNSCISDDSNPALLTVDANKRITAQTENTEACVGDDFTFAVNYKNTTVACEWEYSTGGAFILVPVGVGTSLETVVDGTIDRNTLTVLSATSAMSSWKFRARVKEGVLADDISNEVEVEVYEPTDFTAIVDNVLCKNESVSFNVIGLSGTGPYTYEWKRDVTSIGTNSSLNLSSATATDNTYYIGVGNGVCPVTTKSFTITHFTDLVITGITDIDPVCHGISEDLVVSFTKDPTLAVTYTWTKDGAALVGNTSTYSIDGSSPSQTGLYKVDVDDGCMTKSISSFVNVLDDIALVTTSPVTTDLCEGEDLNLHVTGSGVGLVYNWYKTTESGTILSSNETLELLNMLSDDAGIYRCDLSSASGCNTDFIEFTVNVRKHATISNPVAVSICEGTGNAVFDVTATGNGALVYKWYDDDVLIPSVSTSSLSVVSLLANNGHSYHCTVSGDYCDEAKSEKANLSVNEDVAIVSHPVDLDVDENGSASFTAGASGTEPYTYQWYENGVDMGNKPVSAQTKTLNLLSVPLSHNGYQYYCKVTNDCTDSDSNLATITLTGDNRIRVQAQNTEACEASSFSFEVQYTNTTDDCVWEYSTGGAFVTLPVAIGAGSETNVDADTKKNILTVVSATTAMNTWKFRAVVKRTSFVDNISNEVEVKVFSPALFADVLDVKICKDAGVSFGVNELTGTGPFTYEWKRDGASIGTNSSLNLNATDASDGGYSVQLSDGVCSPVTDGFNISHFDDLVIDNITDVDTVCHNVSEDLIVTITKDALKSVTYKWFKGDDATVLSSTNTYTVAGLDKTESGLYKVVVFDGCMTKSVSSYVNVLNEITKTSTWNDQTLCLGDDLLLEAKVNGDNPTYLWTVPAGSGRDPGDVANLIIDALVEADTGTYTCEITGTCGVAVTYSTAVVVNKAPNVTTGIEALTSTCIGDNLVLGPIVYDDTRDESIRWILPDGSVSGETSVTLNLGSSDLSMEGNYKVEVSNACGDDFSLGSQDVNPLPTLDAMDDQVACQGEDVVFRAVATGENLTYRWFVDGDAKPLFDDKAELIISDIQPLDPNTSINYVVECKVSACGIGLVESAQVEVKPNTILHSSIKGEVVYVESDYEFSLNVTGFDLSYEWHHISTDGIDIKLLETTSVLQFSNLSLTDAGEYSCTITGDCGTRFTSGFLTVKDPLKIVSGLNNLIDIEKCFGDPLNLNISVKGEVYTIDWFKNDVDLDHHELNYFIPELDTDDAGSYRCEITGEGANLTETVDLIVYQPTVLKSHLVDYLLCEEQNLLWIPDVSGSRLTYDWKYKGVTISTESSLNILNAKVDQAGDYSVDILGKCGSVSTEATVEVQKLPFYISHSDKLEVCEKKDEIIFEVNYGGDDLVYQWQKEGVNIEGAMSSELKIQNLRTTDAGTYSCVVTSTCNLILVSPNMELVIIPQLKILSQSKGMELCEGLKAGFSVEVEGTNEVYQWSHNGDHIIGANAPNYEIASSRLLDDGYYACEISDKCTSKRFSDPKQLDVHALPNSQIYGRMELCVFEDRVAYTSAVIPNLDYDWQVVGGEFTTPDTGFKTKITWGELDKGNVRIIMLDEVTGCYSNVDSLVKLHKLPEVNLSTQESHGVCEAEFELEGGFPEGGIYWVNGVSENFFDPIQGDGTYSLRYSYTDEHGCSNTSDETVLIIDSLPKVKLIEDVTVGACKTQELWAQTDEDNIKWSPARYLDDPYSNTPIFSSGESTLFVATSVDKFGCVGNDIVNVTVAELPLITTINDTVIGKCKLIELTTHIVGDISEINWTNKDHLSESTISNPILADAPVGVNNYQINVTDKYGCVASESIEVDVKPNPEVGDNQFLCEGETYIVNTRDLSNPIWSDGYTAWERIIDKPGDYELRVTDFDCEVKQAIVMHPIPAMHLNDTLIFEGQTVALNPDLDPTYGPYVFDWSDGSVSTVLEVNEANVYRLTVEDNIGCVAIDSAVVIVKAVGIESPNAFSPLSKNENNRFYLKEINVIESFDMYIYNRWGELMYKTDKPGYAYGWDGTFKGEDCPVGAYVWILMLNGEMKEKGNLILVR